METVISEGWRYLAGYGTAFAGKTELGPLETDTGRMWVAAQKQE